MPSSDPRRYLIGETVILTVAASTPGDRRPTDPAAVVLDAVVLNKIGYPNAVALIGEAFERIGAGDYEFRLQTAGWEPGVYTWRARATDGTTGVALKEDTFVLELAA